jgi:hypothetical protein
VGITSAIGIALTTIAKLSVAMRAFALTPAGAVITALSVIGGLIAATVVHQNEMSKVTLENAEALIKQKDELEVNVTQYDQLKYRAKLTNEELARFVDINSEISKTADPNLIPALKDEQEKLREKSGLSNDELSRMVELNGKIIEAVPNATVAITDQGNALLENTDAAKKYNKEQPEMLRLELEHQKNKADANMNKNLVKEKRLLEEINDLNTKRKDMAKAIEEQEKLVREATEGINKAKEDGNQAMVTYWENELILAQQDLQISKDANVALSGKLQKKQESLEKVQEEIGKLDEVKRKMIDLELKQAGINAKRGEELRTIDLSLAKLEAQKRKLEETTPIAQRNSE